MSGLRFSLVLVVALLSSSVATASFVTFETGQVRPLAISPDGTRLYAVNTPDNRLEIFNISGVGLHHSGSVPVGLEPIAVVARTNSEVWVVNHLSDSVSIVDVAAIPPRVTRTLLVGDEPRDIVVSNGTVGERVFITTARRGQNAENHSSFPIDPMSTVPGTERALVWAFDPNSLGASLEGDPLSVVELFSDTPRALAVAPDGNSVYAAAFHSGNQTTSIVEAAVCDGGAGAGSCSGGAIPGGLPAPNTNFQGIPGPEVGLIVKLDQTSGNWEDELGRNWNNAVRFSLPDTDVFEISTSSLTQMGSWSGVGTVLFNMVTNPVSGKVYVSNTDARNEVRFEGPGVFAANFKPPGEPASVIGHLHEARITVLDGTAVEPRHLNKHINYDIVPSPGGTKAASLATPLGMAVTSDGSTLYVAAFGSSKVGIFDTAMLENDTFVPAASNHISVTGGGTNGLVLDEANDRLYVFTRFDNSISIIDTVTETEVGHLPVYNPEPANVVDGRPFLYDAVETSSNGEASCASCHIFGDFDSLGWDLGDPDGTPFANNNPFVLTVGPVSDFHPMKGPMTTQSLRGMANHGPMHWRGDRTGGGGQALNEQLAFIAFNPAFEGLIGRDGQLTAAQMQAFTDFILEVAYPPNPNRALDNSLTAQQQGGSNLYFGRVTDTVFDCNGCHELDPSQGFFGGDGQSSFEGETQEFKVAHLRNAYQKVGMFGLPGSLFMGPQVRGFGYLHDGGVDTVFRFLNVGPFTINETEERNLEAFIMAFDTTFAPIVGQQTTLTHLNGATVGSRIDLLIARAGTSFPLVGMPGARECDLVVKGTFNGEARGWVMNAAGLFRSDRLSEALLTDGQLRAIAGIGGGGQDLTYMCVPPGSGDRIGIDRDEDGFFDRDEIDAGSDPADPLNIPGDPTHTPTPTSIVATETPTAFVPTATPAGTATATSPPLPTPTLPPTAQCNSGILITKAQLQVSRNDNPAGDEKIKIKGEFVITNTAPPIDPIANGLSFDVIDTVSGQSVLSCIVPNGASPGGSVPGWTINGSGTRWKFKDSKDVLGTGITKVTVRDKSSKTAGLYQVRLQGKDANFQIGTENLELVVILGGAAQAAADQCASRPFNPSTGAAPKCELKSGGRSLKCK